jgi:hypothetical protein
LDGRGSIGGDQPEAAEGDGEGVRGDSEGASADPGHQEAGRAVALRALHQPLRRAAGLRQEGPGGARAQGGRPRDPLRRRPRAGGAPRHALQRRQPQRLLAHVMHRL